MIEPLFTFDVDGRPAPQGSHDPAGSSVRHSSPHLGTWRHLVATFARQAYLGRGTLDEPGDRGHDVPAAGRTRPPARRVADHAALHHGVEHGALELVNVGGRGRHGSTAAPSGHARKRYVGAGESEGVSVAVWRWVDVDSLVEQLLGASA